MSEKLDNKEKLGYQSYTTKMEHVRSKSTLNSKRELSVQVISGFKSKYSSSTYPLF